MAVDILKHAAEFGRQGNKTEAIESTEHAISGWKDGTLPRYYTPPTQKEVFSIRDIALMTGSSPNTVSRVARGVQGVRPHLADRVRTVLEILEYKPLELSETSRKKNAVTLKDVATRAGVSISTASRVLNLPDKDRSVTRETIQKVQKVAAELGYQPSTAFQQIRTRRKEKI